MRYGAFMRGIEMIDTKAFGLSPNETVAMDPQQRLLLEHGYAALHNSRHTRVTLGGTGTGVYLGYSGADFATILKFSPLGGSVYAATGSVGPIACGRLSYVFGLHGPCFAVDSACSAALTAAHAGLRGLQLDECDMGLVCGVWSMLSPGLSYNFAVAGMTSETGRSLTFDARANGYARCEACGAFTLDRKPNASIIDVVGSAIRQDGKSASLTAPNGSAQVGLILAALADAATMPTDLAVNETHGTGTSLGDPIEAGSYANSVLVNRVGHPVPGVVGGIKATMGHAEPVAGMTGLLKLVLLLRGSEVAPNAQLHVLNEHVAGTMAGYSVSFPLHHAALPTEKRAGGVSSFGYSGTINHVILHRVEATDESTYHPGALTWRRRPFPWREQPHPFAQRERRGADGSITFCSPAAPDLLAIVADHMVKGRVIFPGTGYLEMARAAGGRSSALRNVIFLQPLAVETPGLFIECAVHGSKFEVRSGALQGHGQTASLLDSTTHCVGELAKAAADAWRVHDPVARRAKCPMGFMPPALYESFNRMGLEYGPSFRRLAGSWGSGGEAASRLHHRSVGQRQGTAVHPADLDAAITMTILIEGPGDSKAARLPFGVDEALLRRDDDHAQWATVSPQATEGSYFVCIGSAKGGKAAVQLTGFKSRALSAQGPMSSHPLLQCAPSVGRDATIFKQPLHGKLYELTSDHVVGGMYIFPAAGFLELFNAVGAACASDDETLVLKDAVIQRPLLEEPGLLVECVFVPGKSFEVRSGQRDASVGQRATHFGGTVSLTPALACLATAHASEEQGALSAADKARWAKYLSVYGKQEADAHTPCTTSGGAYSQAVDQVTPGAHPLMFPTDVGGLVILSGYVHYGGTINPLIPYSIQQTVFTSPSPRHKLALASVSAWHIRFRHCSFAGPRLPTCDIAHTLPHLACREPRVLYRASTMPFSADHFIPTTSTGCGTTR